jgi:acyl-CoA thioester hydrolase
MAKPDLWRLNPASYPISITTGTRFQDLDINGHLNNVSFAALFENARVRVNRAARLGEDRAPGERTMVAAVSINYLGEGQYPDDVTVCTGVGPIGTSSWTLFQAMFQNGHCIATCDSVIVCRLNNQRAPLRDALRAELELTPVKPVG